MTHTQTINDSSEQSHSSSEQDVILVTGATGYIGGRLVPRLLESGHRVRVITRNPQRLAGRSWVQQVEVMQADALDPASLVKAMQGVRAVYYLIHSMRKGEDFHKRDQDAARNFSQAARQAGVERIIYLGGLGEEDSPELSEHLASRHEVGRILREAGVPVTEFRAAVIVGAGSTSFEMIRYLTERLPVMICPRWVYTRVQPLSIQDVLLYLTRTLDVPESAGEIIEIGGTDVLQYADMLTGYAAARGLKRYLIPVPLLTPNLSSHWVHYVTPIPGSIARPLVDGLRNEVVVRDDKARRLFPDIVPIGYDEAVSRALDELRAARLETSWSDSLASSGAAHSYEFTEERGMMIERRQRLVNAPARNTYRAFTRLGGDHGWLYLNWLWYIRGVMDRVVGGPGYRRGRRDPQHLRVGDALDFWRVEALEPERMVRLRAEMKLPGQGWLEFEVEPRGEGRSHLTQTAYFAPTGLFGFLYWYSIYIIHRLIFDGMIDALVQEAEQMAADGEPAGEYELPIQAFPQSWLVTGLIAAAALLVVILARGTRSD